MNLTIDELNNIKQQIFDKYVSLEEKEKINEEINNEIENIIKKFDEKNEDDFDE